LLDLIVKLSSNRSYFRSSSQFLGIMQAHSWKLYFYPFLFSKNVSLLLPSHNYIIFTVFSFQGTLEHFSTH